MTTKMLRALIIACVPFTTFPAAGMTLGGPPTHAPDRPAGVTVWRTAPADVSSSFAAIVSNRNIPGLMGVRLDGGMVTASGIAGVRVRGQNGNALQISDVMHYGSMFKAQTATLGGILVDAGVITWDARLLDYVTPTQKSAFIATDARWTNVTLRQLLSMSSGVKEELVPYDIPAVYRCNANPAAGRQYLADLLSRSKLFADPGTAFYYSNFGYGVAGLMLEVAWNRFSGQSVSYEQLMQRKLFGPLGVTTGICGVPGMSNTTPTNLPAADPSPVAIGHSGMTNDPAEGFLPGDPVGLGCADAENPLLVSPAGTWAMSMSDYAKLLNVQMQTNQSPLLDRIGLSIKTLVDIRTPVILYPATNAFSFSLGWLVDNATTSHLVYTGSNERWVSSVDARLDSQVAVVAACNQGGANQAVNEALAVLAAIPSPRATTTGNGPVKQVRQDDGRRLP